MYLKNFNKNVYFCTSLVEITPINTDDKQLKPIISDMRLESKMLCSFKDINCPRCIQYNLQSQLKNTHECDLNLFEIGQYLKVVQIGKRKFQKDEPVDGKAKSSPTNHSQNYLFFTQTDIGYFNQGSEGALTSQHQRENSILDAFENVGYYGFVTFRATVQRIGFMRYSFDVQSSSLTQSLSTQFSTQRSNFK
jgi:hypothetical protein